MKIKILLLAFSFTALIGCSSDYDDAKTYLKCGIAARHLEQFKGLNKIQQKLDRFNNLQLLTPRDIAMMAEETREEIGLSNGESSDFWKLLNSGKYKIMCINDGFNVQDEEKVMVDFIKAMNQLFPEKSSFEI